MLEPFSGIINTARRAQMESRRCESEAILPADLDNWGGAIEDRAMLFLEQCCANRYWYWVVLEQAARHAIGPRIQLAHVVNALNSVRRQHQACLLTCDVSALDRDRLALAVAQGAVVLSSDAAGVRYLPNRLFLVDFDPARAAALFGSSAA